VPRLSSSHPADVHARLRQRLSQQAASVRAHRQLLSALAVFALGTALPGFAQDVDPSDILRATPIKAEQCDGPLGSLMPECRAGKTAINISNQAQSAEELPTRSLRSGPESTPARANYQQPEVGPAEPPTQLQRFVASSVGQVLPIFGASLFEKVPATFAPLDRVPVTADYVVGPGDQLLVRVWGQVNLDLQLTVDRAGSVFVPQAGSINVAGIQFQQLPDFLRLQLSRVFRNFDLTVTMGQLRSIQVFVVGQVRRPGSYTVSSLSTLINALFASGGPSGQGSMRHVQLKRGSTVESELDLYDLLLKGDKSRDARLLPGDVVYVPSVGPQVAIAGSVKTPAIYELNREDTVAEVIQMAGGLSAVANAQRATLERIQARTSREVVDVRLDADGMANKVADGDLISIGTIPPRFSNAITLRGNVADSGRFTWHLGMHLRDIIPDKDSLVTRDYWKKRNILGFTPAASQLREPAAEAASRPAINGIAETVPDINWSYAVIERQDPTNLATDLIPFHLGKLVLNRDESQNLELRAGDVVTIFSQADFRVPQSQQTRLVRLEGELAAAGVYAVRPGETLGQLIRRAGGLTPQAYLYAAEFTRESTRVDQQRRLDQFLQQLEHEVERTASNKVLSATSTEQSTQVNTKLESERTMIARMRSVRATGRIVLVSEPGSNDISQLMDFPLEDGDRFQVPSRPATVNVLGAVYNQNSFLQQRGKRAADYLRQAGGPTRSADSAHQYIIRADGSVQPKQGGFRPFSHTFESTTLYPGDTLVVPESTFRTTFFQGLRDWSQVISQMALGAAAVNVLK
jgi:polysaccharide biosynthesis/export protein